MRRRAAERMNGRRCGALGDGRTAAVNKGRRRWSTPAIALVSIVAIAACSSESTTGSPPRAAGPQAQEAPKAAVAAPATKPAKLCPESDELFCARSPHAFVQTGSHGEEVSPLALKPGAPPAAETPVVLNGVNLKQGPYRKDGEWTTELVDTEMSAMAAAGAPGFSVVRIALDWPRFQYRAADGTITIDPEGLAALDRVIDAAAAADVHVILDLIHVRVPDGPCAADDRLAGAKWNVPAWAWERVTGRTQDADCKARPEELGDLMDEVLVLPETTGFIRTILERYDASSARGRNVVAVEPVSEPESSGDSAGSATSRTQHLIDSVYSEWLAAQGPASLRRANATKILILGPIKGDTSLAGVTLAPIARPNIVWSHHDYTLAVTGRSGAGAGYSDSGYASAQVQDRSEQSRPGSPSYDPELVPYQRRLSERRDYLAQMQGWAAAGGLPIFVGEYGVPNSCSPTGDLATAEVYAQHSRRLYDGATIDGEAAPVSRTWWQLSIGGRFGGEYALLTIDGHECPGTDAAGWMPYADELTGGRTR